MIIPPRIHALGDGFSVNRVLPYAKKRMVGPFIFWDHMGPIQMKNGDELSVRPHPHIGLATLTYLFEGEILHRDSLGYEQKISPGEVNWMIAGKGISHSERSAPIKENKGKSLHGIQVWIALPKEFEEIAPSFHHFDDQSIPRWEDEGQFSLIAGEAFGRKSPVPTHSNLFYLDIKLKAKQQVHLPLHTMEGAAYVVKGKVKAGSETIAPLEMGVMTGILSLEALEDSHILLLGGDPLPEDRNIWWNFVHSSKERIEQAKADWKAGRFGTVIHETEFIPLPEE